MSRNDVLVPADWAQEHIGQPGIVFVEVDEDTSAYDKGHLEGAVKLDWRTDLQDPLRRDFVDREQFEQLLSAKGIANEDTVVLYGGNNNWFAAYAYWYLKLYGHDQVKLLDGGRKKWEPDSRPPPPAPSCATAAARRGSSTAARSRPTPSSAPPRSTPRRRPTPPSAPSAPRRSPRAGRSSSAQSPPPSHAPYAC